MKNFILWVARKCIGSGCIVESFINLLSYFYITLISVVIILGPLSFKAEALVGKRTAAEYKFDTKRTISVNLGKKSQTRISVYPHSIKEIIGDSEQYLVVHDTSGRYLYLLPKVKVGERVNLSIVTTSGKVQDFDFKVTDTKGSTIILNLDSTLSLSDNKAKEKSEKKEEIKSLLTSMVKGEYSKYHVKDFTGKNHKSQSQCRDCDVKNVQTTSSRPNKFSKWGMKIDLKDIPDANRFKKLEIRNPRTYFYAKEGLKGLVLYIFNTSKEEKNLEESDFAALFEGAKIVSIENKILLPKKSTRVFVILQNKDSDHV